MKFTNFENYVLRRLEESHGQYYSTYEEFQEHMLSGEVTVTVERMLQFNKDFQDQLNEKTWAQKLEDEYEERLQEEIRQIDSWTNSILTGKTTGNGLLDYLTKS